MNEEILIALSTSENSQNVINIINEFENLEIPIFFTGKLGENY